MHLAPLVPCCGLVLASLLLVDRGADPDAARPSFDWDGTTIAMIDVADLEAGQRFYAEVLGLEPLFAVPEHGWAELRLPTPNAVLGLSQVDEDRQVRASASFSLGVRDLAAVHERLVAAEVEFAIEPYEIDGLVKLAEFVDPWGNKVMLHQSLTPPMAK